MTDDADEAAYLRREQARFRFFKRIEDAQQDSETPAGAPSTEPAIAPSQNNSQANSPAPARGVINARSAMLLPNLPSLVS
jgi:hypothetical protein